jgi:hypothetical protein
MATNSNMSDMDKLLEIEDNYIISKYTLYGDRMHTVYNPNYTNLSNSSQQISLQLMDCIALWLAEYSVVKDLTLDYSYYMKEQHKDTTIKMRSKISYGKHAIKYKNWEFNITYCTVGGDGSTSDARYNPSGETDMIVFEFPKPILLKDLKQLISMMFLKYREEDSKSTFFILGYEMQDVNPVNKYVQAKKKIKDSNIYAKTSIMTSLEEDISKFIKNKDFYIANNITHSKIYLLHGPEDCGKMNLVYYIASKYNYCIMKSVTGSTHSWLALGKFNDCILLIDNPHVDIHEPQIVRDYIRALTKNCGQTNLLIFIVTSQSEDFEPIIKNKGHVDKVFKLEYYDEEQIYKMINIMMPSQTNNVQEFYKIVKKAGIKLTEVILQKFILEMIPDTNILMDSSIEVLKSIAAQFVKSRENKMME